MNTWIVFGILLASAVCLVGLRNPQRKGVVKQKWNSFTIFHTHPALERDVTIHSSNYRIGYGHLPHVAQGSNISSAVYEE